MDTKERRRLAQQRRRARVKAELEAYKLEHGCVDCGYRDNAAALQFDHKIPHNGTRYNVSTLVSSRTAAFAEVAMCDVRCANCHAIRHYAPED